MLQLQWVSFLHMMQLISSTYIRIRVFYTPSVVKQAPEATLTSSCHYNTVMLVLPKMIRDDY